MLMRWMDFQKAASKVSPDAVRISLTRFEIRRCKA